MKWFMMLLLLLPSLVLGQAYEVEPGVWKLPISGFTGINTQKHKRAIQPNEFIQAHEVDFSRNGVLTVSKRLGYDSIGTIGLIDSLVSIDAVQFRDGREYLVIIGPDTTTDSTFGVIYITNEGSTNVTTDSLTEAYRGFPVLNKPSYAMLDDKLFIVSGSGRGVTWNGDVWRDWPLAAPGEPKIIPMNVEPSIADTATYILNGTYVYTFTHAPSDSSDGAMYDCPGYISSRVKVKNGRMMLSEFQWVWGDSANPARDSMRIDIYRSRGDFGRMEVSDSAWYIGRYIFDSTSASLDTIVFIDSIPDDSLAGVNALPLVSLGSAPLWLWGREPLAGAYVHRYGAPGYDSTIDWMGADTTAGAGDRDTLGVYAHWPEPEGMDDAVGVVYACTFIDTVTGIESAMGPPLAIIKKVSPNNCHYAITLPRISGRQAGTNINLYRNSMRAYTTHSRVRTYHDPSTVGKQPGVFACIRRSSWPVADSTISFADTTFHGFGPPPYLTLAAKIEKHDCDDYYFWLHTKDNFKDQYTIDSFYMAPSGWRLLAQLPTDDTTYIDSANYKMVDLKTHYRTSGRPPLMHGLFSYQRWLYGIDGNKIMRSDVGNPNSWNLMEQAVEVGKGDGDEITAAWISRTNLRVAKNYSTYNINPQTFSDAFLVSNWGCIAPQSVIQAPPGTFYLSADGVILENEGLYLTGTYQSPNISIDKIGDFSDLSMISRKRAVGMWVRDRSQYWLTIGDTTYIYDWKASRAAGAPVWSTSSVTLGGATSYDTDDELEFMPGRTMYFWDPYGGSTRFWYGGVPHYDTTGCKAECDSATYGINKVSNQLQKFGTSETDNGSYVQIAFQTGALLWGDGFSQLKRIGVTVTGATAAEALTLAVIGPLDTVITMGTIDSMTREYRGYEYSIAPKLYYRVGIFSYGQGSYWALTGNTFISQIDIYYTLSAEPHQWNWQVIPGQQSGEYPNPFN